MYLDLEWKVLILIGNILKKIFKIPSSPFQIFINFGNQNFIFLYNNLMTYFSWTHTFKWWSFYIRLIYYVFKGKRYKCEFFFNMVKLFLLLSLWFNMKHKTFTIKYFYNSSDRENFWNRKKDKILVRYYVVSLHRWL